MTQQEQKYNIICLSNQLWDFPNWTNKRQVMMRLAKAGHTVLFVDPPINLGNVFLQQLKRKLWGFQRILTQLKQDECGATIFSPLNFLPYGKFTSKLHTWRINTLARNLFKQDQKTILWTYHVQIAELQTYIEGLHYDLLVYDCVDNYSAFPEVKAFYRAVTSRGKTETQEEYLTKKADIVFASAPGLLDKLRKFNKNVYFTPNVGDYEKFKNVDKLKDQVPLDLRDISHPVIGFTGALDEYKFDIKLFKRIVEDYPNYSYILIGQFALKDKNASLDSLGLSKYKNVYHLGYRDYKTVEFYFAGFDAYIIPYQLNDYTVGGCFPVKFHDSLAAGLPTIVTALPAYQPFNDVCYISKSYKEFSDNLKLALEENNSAKMLARKEVAKKNNWEGKVETMLTYVGLALKAPKDNQG